MGEVLRASVVGAGLDRQVVRPLGVVAVWRLQAYGYTIAAVLRRVFCLLWTGGSASGWLSSNGRAALPRSRDCVHRRIAGAAREHGVNLRSRGFYQGPGRAGLESMTKSREIRGRAIVLTLLALTLFGSAGRLDIAEFWFYVVVIAGVNALQVAVMDPDLMRERRRPGGQDVSSTIPAPYPAAIRALGCCRP